MKKFQDLKIGEQFKFYRGCDNAVHMRVDVPRYDERYVYLEGDTGGVAVSYGEAEVMTKQAVIREVWK